MMFLAGDIGGTKTHLALFDKSLKRLNDHKFGSQDYPNLLDIVKEFLKEERAKIAGACFGIAGPIEGDRCVATNLPWVIDAKELGQAFGIPKVTLLNDLEANAHGLMELKESDFFVLNRGEERGGNRALISAGTGLGEAGIYFDGKNYNPFACEGGHTDFSPRDEREIELFLYLKKRVKGRVSYERVLSGPGIGLLYDFLTQEKKMKADPEIEKLSEKERSPRISERGVRGENATCKELMEWFVSFYGAEAGNLFLKFLALGGVYIGGGIAPKILDLLKGGTFMKSFVDKGRMERLLEKTPVKVVLNEETALLGSAAVARKKEKDK